MSLPTRRAKFVRFIWFIWFGAYVALAAEGVLTNRQKSLVRQQVVPAYLAEQTKSASELLASMLENLSPEELVELNQVLEQAGTPPVADILLESRLLQLLPSAGQRQFRLEPREASLILPVLLERVTQLLDAATALDADGLPADATLQRYQDAFWEIHVAQNQLRNAVQLTKYGMEFLDQAMRGKRRGAVDGRARASSRGIHGFCAEARRGRRRPARAPSRIASSRCGASE